MKLKTVGSNLILWLGILTFALLFPLTVLADGIVMPQTAYALPQIPDQRALLHYANGTETLVIETSFSGEGTNFAWIVPLPGVPRIEPASAGLLPTLQTIFLPQVVLSARHYWLALPIAALVVGMIHVARRNTFHFLLIYWIGLLLTMLILPLFFAATHKGLSSGPLTANVRVLNRETVGLFDTVTLKSTTPTALVDWLNHNGFLAPTNIMPAVEAYIRDGWVFVAARLHREGGQNALQATHPLAFTFPTAKAVYPLRLTAAGTTACRVDLYVFGPQRASAPGFSVQRCDAPVYGLTNSAPRFSAGELRIRHAELAKLVAAAPVATKLTALLGPAQMTRDACIGWEAYRPCGNRVYASGAALTVSGNVTAFVFMALVLVYRLLSHSRFGAAPDFRKWKQWLAPVALGVGICVYCFGLSRTDSSSFRAFRFSRGMIKNNGLYLALSIEDQLAESTTGSNGPALEVRLDYNQTRRFMQSFSRDTSLWRPHPLTNLFTGELIQFEASPGNFMLRPATQAPDYELVWHDLDGAEALTFPVRLP